jgi:predicted Zn-dependent protease
MRALVRLACAMLAIALASCRNPEIGPLAAGEARPPDEVALWNESRQWDERVAASKARVDDAALQAYVDQVGGRVYRAISGRPPEEVRVFVIRTPFLNASASPTGTVLLHTGLLARLEDEAELATLLGHELAHFVGRHALREQRLRRNEIIKRRVTSGIALVVLMNPLLIDTIGAESSESLARQLNGYSAALEREADRAGFEAMRAAGYDVRRSVRLFEAAAIDDDAAKVPDPYYYADHPSMDERAAHYRELIAATPNPVGEVGAERYEAQTERLIADNVRDDLDYARVRSAKRGVDRLLARPSPSADAYFLSGEWLRLNGDADDLAKAAEAYGRATRLDPKHVGAARANGLALRALGQREAAAAELERAIALDPTAAERPILESYVRELRRP